MSGGSSLSRVAAVILVGVIISASGTAAGEQINYLDTRETIGVTGSSLLILGLGSYIKQRNDSTRARWVNPPGFDVAISRFLGRRAGVDKQNPIDSDFGSAVTSLGAGLVLGLTDYHYPRGDRDKSFWQNQLVFYSGVIATKGVTDFFKGVVARQRPLAYLEPELAATRTVPNPANDHHSFFSGHASSAFFAMTFLNLRIREAMRQELTPDEFRHRRWLPSTLCLGWAGYVAFSRIQAYQHYSTDVLVGSLVGYAMGELYYAMSSRTVSDEDSAGSPLMFRVGFSF